MLGGEYATEYVTLEDELLNRTGLPSHHADLRKSFEQSTASIVWERYWNEVELYQSCVMVVGHVIEV